MDKELIKLLRSLCEPSLSEFIDWDKFLLSPKFTKISQSLIEHFQNNGESIFINRLLIQLSELKIFKPILLWFCDSAGLDYFFTDSKLTLKRARNTRKKEGDIEDYRKKYSGTAKDVAKNTTPMHLSPTDKKQESLKNTNKNKSLVDADGFFSSYPKQLNGVPLEYQAAVYAKQTQLEMNNLHKNRTELKTLKEKLRITQSETERVELQKKISSKEKAIRKAPKPMSKWSPLLPGSFESGKNR